MGNAQLVGHSYHLIRCQLCTVSIRILCCKYCCFFLSLAKFTNSERQCRNLWIFSQGRENDMSLCVLPYSLLLRLLWANRLREGVTCRFISHLEEAQNSSFRALRDVVCRSWTILGTIAVTRRCGLLLQTEYRGQSVTITSPAVCENCWTDRDSVCSVDVGPGNYNVSQENVPPLVCYNVDTHERILIFFLAEMLPIK